MSDLFSGRRRPKSRQGLGSARTAEVSWRSPLASDLVGLCTFFFLTQGPKETPDPAVPVLVPHGQGLPLLPEGHGARDRGLV